MGPGFKGGRVLGRRGWARGGENVAGLKWEDFC